MIQSLCDIRAAKERFPDLPTDQVTLLSMICTRILNGATWHEITERLELGRLRWDLTLCELGEVLKAFNPDELDKLYTRQERNLVEWNKRLKQDCELAKWHKAHPRISVWPEYDPNALVGDTETIAIQVNGKLRGTIEVPINTSQLLVEDAALQDNRIKVHIEGKRITRKVFVKGRVLNFVVQDRIG